MKCLFANGCVYAVANGNLLYHASMPLNADGTLKDINIQGELYHGKALLKKVGALIRSAYFGDADPEVYNFALDYIWYLWCGKDSPVFDKDKMATFERYFIEDKCTHKEIKGHYYTLRDKPEICDMILDEFGIEGNFRHIINGHVPVLTIEGENPVKAGGKLMVIDGGFSKAYQPKTGIAGYTLVYHSRGFQLVQHEPFTSITKAVEEGQEIHCGNGGNGKPQNDGKGHRQGCGTPSTNQRFEGTASCLSQWRHQRARLAPNHKQNVKRRTLYLREERISISLLSFSIS